MKTRLKWWAASAFALGLGACSEREQPVEPELPAAPAAEAAPPAADPLPTPEPVPVLPELDASARAAKLGFARYLPADIEMLAAVYDGAKNVERLQALKVWQLMTSQVGGRRFGEKGDFGFDPEMEMEFEDGDLFKDEFDIEPLDEAAAEEGDEMFEAEGQFGAADSGPGVLLGREVTLAVGKNAGEQVGHALTLNNRITYFRMREMAREMVKAVEDDEFGGFDEFEKLIGDLMNDPASGTGLFEKMNMPPVYLAFRAPEGQLDVAAQQVAGSIQMIEGGEVVVPLELERGGSTFLGYKIVGENIAKLMDSEREEIESTIDPETLDKFLVALTKKNLVVLSGTLDDYVVMFIGGSEDDFLLAETPAASLGASDALAFADAYLDKDLAAVVYGGREALRTVVNQSGGLAEIAKGFQDGLSGSAALGDTRDLETLLQIVAEREATLRKLATTDATGIVAFLEDGVKIEAHGGTDSGAFDWEAPLKLAHLGDPDDVVLFANMSSDAEYDAAARAYFDSLLETAYAMTLKLSEVSLEASGMEQFNEMAEMFNENFRQDAVALWEALSGDFADGLGAESALVMDLRGSMPAFPGVPQAVVNEAKFPRLSLVAPVTDRSKLAASWEKLNASSTNILARISEMSGRDIPMQRPTSSERNGLTTWFFSLPFTDDDFNASVTVGEEWFAASSSRLQALDLIARAAEGGEARTGFLFHLNFRAVHAYARETLRVVEDNAEAIFSDRPAERQDFEEHKETIREAIAAFEEIDRLTIHARREAGELRTSLHVRTR